MKSPSPSVKDNFYRLKSPNTVKNGTNVNYNTAKHAN